jgi:hypothetical protein
MRPGLSVARYSNLKRVCIKTDGNESDDSDQKLEYDSK